MDDKRFDEYILKLFGRVFEKMDKLSDYMDKSNEILAKNTTHLEYHIKRTDQNDEKISMAQERIHIVEQRMVEELARIRTNSQKHEENDIHRFEDLKSHVAKDIETRLDTVMPLIQTICEDLNEKRIKIKLKKESRRAKRERVLFWLKVLGGVGSLLGIILGLKSL